MEQDAGDFDELRFAGLGVLPQPSLQRGDRPQRKFGSAGVAVASDGVELVPEQVIHARMLTWGMKSLRGGAGCCARTGLVTR